MSFRTQLSPNWNTNKLDIIEEKHVEHKFKVWWKVITAVFCLCEATNATSRRSIVPFHPKFCYYWLSRASIPSPLAHLWYQQEMHSRRTWLKRYNPTFYIIQASEKSSRGDRQISLFLCFNSNHLPNFLKARDKKKKERKKNPMFLLAN